MNARPWLGLALTLATAASAGTTHRTPWFTGAQQPPAASQKQPLFRAGTLVVEVDVIVRDRNRQFIGDLGRDDFEVLEDGTPQVVQTLFLVNGPELAPPGAASAAPAASAPALPGGSAQRVIVLLFDLEHIEAGGLDRTRRAAREFLVGRFQPGDVGGIVSGSTMINNRLTSSREELVAALDRVKPTGESRSRNLALREWPRILDATEAYRIAVRQDREALARAVARAAADDPGSARLPLDALVLEKATKVVADARTAGKRSLDTVIALATGLGRLPGRKTVVLLSDGFFTEEAWADLRQATGRAARSSVRIYSVDTRGLNRGSGASDLIDEAQPGAPGDRLPDINALADGPNSLAVDTGGFAIRNENDLGKALGEIERDTSTYYVLGYRPTNNTLDGRFRQIQVGVKRTGVSVRARRGYVASPELVPITPPTSPSPVSPPGAATPAGTREVARPGGEPGATLSARPAGGDVRPERPARALSDEASGGETAGAVRLRPTIRDEVRSLAGAGRRAEGAEAAPLVAPDDVIRQAKAGWEAYERGELPAARAALSQAASHPAAPPWVHYALGWTEYALGDPVAAASRWELVREKVAEFEAVYFDLADAYLQQREFGKAVSVLRDAEHRWPGDVEVYNALGVVQTGRGALTDAIATFEKAVGVNPNDATAAYNLARVLELRYVQAERLRRVSAQTTSSALQDRDRALVHYQRVVQLGGPLAESARDGLKRLGAR